MDGGQSDLREQLAEAKGLLAQIRDGMDEMRNNATRARVFAVGILIGLSALFGFGLKPHILGADITTYTARKQPDGSPLLSLKTIYRVSPYTQTVIYWYPDIDESPRRLIDCTVRDVKNWTGTFADGSGTIVMVKGKIALKDSDIICLSPMDWWRLSHPQASIPSVMWQRLWSLPWWAKIPAVYVGICVIACAIFLLGCSIWADFTSPHRPTFGARPAESARDHRLLKASGLIVFVFVALFVVLFAVSAFFSRGYWPPAQP